MHQQRWIFSCLSFLIAVPASAMTLVGTVLDADTSQPIPARVYVQNQSGEWLFVESSVKEGSALPYLEQWVPMPKSVERHTTISAHPFQIDLKTGQYRITIERGKEYRPLSRTIVVTERGKDQRETFWLQRWVNMESRGWFSGETHVHRRIHELPNVMLAEDLNVTFPVTFWTTEAHSAPHLSPSTLRRQGPSPFGEREDRGRHPIRIDDTHLVFPRNTEYEVFNVRGRPHVLGAMFLLNHKSIFRNGVPPVGDIAEQAHREGALIDLDKHNWPWSMMLVPVAKVDLYELSNNSVWRTEFGFRQSMVDPAAYMKVDTDDAGMTELGWLNFGFEIYYTLLNCGFRLQPTAGTASGVHPVPLGFSRVYVHLDGPFDGTHWIDGLRAGRSFVTTGPMLFVKVNGVDPGQVFRQSGPIWMQIRGEIHAAQPLQRVELIVNGQKSPLPLGVPQTTPAGAFRYSINEKIHVGHSSWIAVRCFQMTPKGRVRFAHTAPWHITIDDEPVRPRREEIDYLVRRIQQEIDRNQGVLSDAALSEFHQALRIYSQIADHARD